MGSAEGPVGGLAGTVGEGCSQTTVGVPPSGGICQELGSVFQVQRFCLRDGDGIRTTVFLKGCPLSCLWCHNPEGQKRERQLSFQAQRCRFCGRCGEVCARQVHQFSTAAEGDRGGA